MTQEHRNDQVQIFHEYRKIVNDSGLSSAVLDRCHDPILLIENGIVIFANRKLLEMTGYSATEAIGLPFQSFLSPDYIESTTANYLNRLAGLDNPGKYQVRIITKHGTPLDIDVTAGIIEFERRKIDLVILRDMSERVRYEKSIEERDQFLDSIIEQSPNAMWIADKEGNIIRINQALRESLLIKDEDVIGSYNVFNDIQVKEQGFLDLVTSVFTEGKTVQFTIDYHTGKEPGLKIKTGAHRIIDIVMSPIFGDDNEIIHVVCMQKDITIQKAAEQSLVESEKRYRAIFDNSYDAILLTSTDGDILDANPAACALFGNSKAGLIEGGRDSVIDKEDPRLDYLLYERKQKGFVNAQLTLVKKDGTRFEAELTSTIFYDSQGTELTTMLIRDITERTRMEQSLESINRTLRIVSECNQSLIRSTEESEFLDDICRIITEYGGYLLAWVGFKTEDDDKKIIPVAFDGSGKNYLDGIQVSWAEDQSGSGPTGTALREGLISMVTDIPSDSRFLPWKDRAIEFGFHSVLALPLLDTDSTVFGVLTIYAGRGISFSDEEFELLNELSGDLAYGIVSLRTRKERERAEEARKQSEEKVQAVLESIPQGIIVTELDGTIVQVNPSAVAMFGFEEAHEILGRNALDFSLPDYHETILTKISAAEEENTPIYFEYIAKDNLGKTFSASMSIAYIRDTEGKPVSIVGLFEDITERMKIQEQLVVTDRLASVGELAAGIAHELNNPLTGVIGFSDLILQRDDVSEGVRADLQVINNEALRASQVARHLLTFARKHPNEKTPVNVNNIINVVLELRKYDHTVNDIIVHSDLKRNIPDVTANEFQLQQVFLNLIINAEYFMKESNNRGELSISTSHTEKHVRVIIEDDGPGIPPDHLNTIFNPFFTTKDIGKGTGLGLSISYGIISEHNGTIVAENRESGGARFIIELPIAERQPENDQSAE